MRSLLCFVALKAHCEQPRLGVLAKDKAVVTIAQYGAAAKISMHGRLHLRSSINIENTTTPHGMRRQW
jgi:hypothetical protein